MMRTSTAWLLLLAAALAGFTIFGYLTCQAVDLERVTPESAGREFTAVRDSLGADTPMLRTDETGRIVRDAAAVDPGRPKPSRLRALVYLQHEDRLARWSRSGCRSTS